MTAEAFRSEMIGWAKAAVVAGVGFGSVLVLCGVASVVILAWGRR